RRHRGLTGDPRGDAHGAILAGATGAVGDGDELGLERRQVVERAPQLRLALVVLGREELERDRGPVRGQGLQDRVVVRGVVGCGHGPNGIVTDVNTPAGDSTFRTAVARQLDGFVADQRLLLTDLDPAVGDLVEAAVDFTVGGKLFRPTFCHAGWLLAGGTPADPRIAAAGASFEWLQGSALVHDDLMDGSDTRRGRPSVHRDFEARHVAAGGFGDAEQYGARVAILLGDLMLSWADEHFRRADPDERTARLWDACKSEVVSGQFLDVLAQTRDTLDVASAMHVIRFKSAKYT